MRKKGREKEEEERREEEKEEERREKEEEEKEEERRTGDVYLLEHNDNRTKIEGHEENPSVRTRNGNITRSNEWPIIYDPSIRIQ